MNRLTAGLLLGLIAGVPGGAAFHAQYLRHETPSLGAWSDKALQVESQWASGEYRPEYRISLDHAYDEAGDVNRPKIQITLPASENDKPISVGRAVSIRCNGDELVSTSLSLISLDLRIQFSCFGTRYRVRYVEAS